MGSIRRQVSSGRRSARRKADTTRARKDDHANLLLLANAPDAWDDQSTGTDDGVFDDWTAYTLALSDAGVLLAGAGLHPPGDATSVQVRDGDRLLVDGPYADTKEHLVGFYLIDVPDLDVALDWAARVPSVRSGTVEVRPVQPQLTPDTTLARADGARAR